ncbi:MAG: hypothetical protein DPW16_00490 [Chloroflexi bacterium]|nr:hypothetical protein [Chloroflexota bacterium]
MTNPAITDPAEIRRLVDSFTGWYHRITLPGGIVTPGTNHSEHTLAELDALGLPQDCTGLRVLDISCRDGFFTFELERRGAEVVGIDYVQVENTGFPIASKILGSKATYLVENIYNLSPEIHGTFDIVLFLGLLYHLRNPMLAIEHVRSVTKLGGKVFVESHLIDNFVTLPNGTSAKLADVAPLLENVALIQFYPGDSLLGDHTNKVGPNMAALKALFYEGQFEVEHTAIYSNRGYLTGIAVYNEALEISRRVDQGIENASDAGKKESIPLQQAAQSGPDLSGSFWKISESSAAVSAALDLQSRQWEEERQSLHDNIKRTEEYASALKTLVGDREQELAETKKTIAALEGMVKTKDTELAAVHEVLNATRSAAESQRDSIMEILKAREAELAAALEQLTAAKATIDQQQTELQTIKQTFAYKADQRLRRRSSQ